MMECCVVQIDAKAQLLDAERALGRWVPVSLIRAMAGKITEGLGHDISDDTIHDKLERMFAEVHTTHRTPHTTHHAPHTTHHTPHTTHHTPPTTHPTPSTTHHGGGNPPLFRDVTQHIRAP